MLQSFRWDVCDFITLLLCWISTLEVHCLDGLNSASDSSGHLKDTTVIADQRLQFFCPQFYEKPIKWYHISDDRINVTNLPNENHNPPASDNPDNQLNSGPSKNFQLHDHKLSFSNVTVRNRGWYYCRDKNNRRSNRFYLYVHEPVVILDNENLTLPVEPKTRNFYCKAVGIPRPTLEWLVNGQKSHDLKVETKPDNMASVTSTLLNATMEHPVEYTCRAYNLLVGEKVERVATKKFIVFAKKEAEFNPYPYTQQVLA
ncbi:hypothetical protein Btru_007540 [Bulinus truncatus]|nr:hypothetical protein Btru_007540 [Bulinus truncatus]